VLKLVQQAKGLIGEVQALLPRSSNPNFRERLVAQLETPSGVEAENPEFRQKAESLLAFYEQVFGVDDLVERADEKELW
jgi:hypothetical protein